MSPKDEKVAVIKKTYRKLWSLAHKFSNHNSKITTKMEQFIKEKYLDETFTLTKEDGTQITLPMFVTGKPRKGGQTVYFDPRATEIFTKRHKEELALKANEMEEKNEFISLRALVRTLKMPGNSDEALYKFILKNAIKDTFESEDENGTPQTLNIFEHPVNKMNKSYISIRKDGIPTFIKKHQKELHDLGVPLNEYTTEVMSRPDETMLTPRELMEALNIRYLGPAAQNKFYHLIEKNFALINTKDYQTGEVRPLFQRRWYRKQILCLKKEDLPVFVFKAQKQLKKLGVPQSVLNHYLFKEELQEKTPEMVSLNKFLREHLHTIKASAIAKEIVKSHLHATYLKHLDNGGIEERPVFVKVANSSTETSNYVFASKEAMYAFAKLNKSLLLNNGITSYQYDNLIREENAKPLPQGEVISAAELVEKRIIGTDYMTKLYNYTDKTFTSFSRNGTITKKPYVYTARDKKSGHLKCFVLKEGLFDLLSTYKDELNVQDGVLDALRLQKDILKKSPSMLSIGELLQVMGRGEYICQDMKELIKERAVHDTFICSNGTEKDLFSFAYTPNGQITLFIEAEGIAPFLTREAKNLEKLGITSKHILNTLKKIHQNPNFVDDLIKKRQNTQLVRKKRDMEKRN